MPFISWSKLIMQVVIFAYFAYSLIFIKTLKNKEKSLKNITRLIHLNIVIVAGFIIINDTI